MRHPHSLPGPPPASKLPRWFSIGVFTWRTPVLPVYLRSGSTSLNMVWMNVPVIAKPKTCV